MADEDEYRAAVERLHNCEYPGNMPSELPEVEAERRMRDLWTVFWHDHPDEG